MRRVMIAAISAVLLAIALPSNAQECKFYENKIDPFTGDTILNTRSPFGKTETLRFYKRGNSYIMSVVFSLGGQERFSIPEDSELFIKQENGNIFRLSIVGESHPSHSFSQGYVYTHFNIKYNITKEQLVMIAKEGITDIKLTEYNNDYFLISEYKDKAKFIKEAVVCLLSGKSDED